MLNGLNMLEWYRQIEKEKEELEKKKLKALKCSKCVWFHSESKFCPFNKCFKGKWGEY